MGNVILGRYSFTTGGGEYSYPQPPELIAPTGTGVLMGSSSWTGSGVVHYTTTTNSSSVITDDWGSSTEGLTLKGSSIICLRPKNPNDPACTMYTPHIQVYDAALTTSSPGRRDIELFWVPSRKLYTAL